MLTFVNGRYFNKGRAVISVFDRGFLFGDGIFETVRAYGGKPFALDLHLKRLSNSAKVLKIPLPVSLQRIKDVIVFLIRKNKIREGYIRITLTRGKRRGPGLTVLEDTKPTIVVEASHVKSVECATLTTCSFRKSPSVFFEHKIINLMENVMGLIDAKRKGFFEALFFDKNGFLLEGTRTNVFFVKSKKVFTPSIDLGVFPGITRRFVVEICKKQKIPLKEGMYRLKDIYNADEVFITNSIVGILPVNRFDKRNYRLCKLTNFLREYYNNRVKNL